MELIFHNRYIIEEKIGKGSFGQIYKGLYKEAHDEHKSVDVAIKLVLYKLGAYKK